MMVQPAEICSGTTGRAWTPTRGASTPTWPSAWRRCWPGPQWEGLPLPFAHLRTPVAERDEVRGAPQQCGGHVHHRGNGHLLWREAETQQSPGELPGGCFLLQRQPGENRRAISAIPGVKCDLLEVPLKNEAFSFLQVLTVADLGLKLSQNFTISWM